MFITADDGYRHAIDSFKWDVGNEQIDGTKWEEGELVEVIVDIYSDPTRYHKLRNYLDSNTI